MSNSPRHENDMNNSGNMDIDMQQDLTIDGINLNNSIMHHRRHRASRTFKNPPQPHFCIKERTLDGQELFINVMSWSRIANPVNPLEPVPLYGGMRVGFPYIYSPINDIKLTVKFKNCRFIQEAHEALH
jgi:hypothetical protein